jgi:uncharacterized protein (DUF697 family)
MDERELRANDVVKQHVWLAAGAGLIPLPIVDLVAISGIQLRMLKHLADDYDISFSDNLGKSVTGALLGGVLPTATAEASRSLIKTIPFVGGYLGAVSQPIVAGATTFAVGKVFIQHFESGGTLLDFDASKTKAYFAEQYEKGKAFVVGGKKAKTKPAPRHA